MFNAILVRMSDYRITAEQQRRNVVMAELGVKLHDYQDEHGLTEMEMFAALMGWMQGMVKAIRRTEAEESDG